LEIEAIRLAFVDRLRYLGDASLTPVPYRGVASAGYAAERRRTIDPARAAPDAQPGDPWPFETEARAWQPARSSAGGEGQTTHLTVIDRDHNMVSLTSTLGSAFGSAVVIKGTGITLNNATTWFDPEPGAVASVGPGKRIMSASTPVLVTRDGQPFLAIGAPGGRKVISAIYQCIVHAIDFKLGVQAAISAPRIHSEGRVSLVSSRFPSEVIEGLRRMGHEVVIGEDSVLTEYFARPLGVMLNSETGDLHGGVFQYAPATAVGA
jgi:gamma-glutamyltranspeptidase/glutathione hydrolase